MTDHELVEFIKSNCVNERTIVTITYSENGSISTGHYRINFFFGTNLPAINNGIVGVRKEIFLGEAFQSVVGGLDINSIISISL